MKPTLLGVKGAVFLGVLIAAFYAAAYQNLFFLLLGFLGVLSALTAYWCWANLRRVSAEVLALAPVPAGAAPLVRVALTARGGAAQEVTARIALGRKLRTVAHVARVTGRTIVAGYVDPLPRGIHEIAGYAIESTHPFGLFRAWVHWPHPAELIVHPRPARLDGLRSLRSAIALFGGQARSRAGEPVVAGLRELRDGEDQRQVHWKASARRGDLVVREWDRSAPEQLVVVVDRRTDAERLEHALSIVMALVELCRAGNETLTVRSQGHAASYGQDQRPWEELLRWLAAADLLPANAAAPPVADGAIRLPPRKDAAP